MKENKRLRLSIIFTGVVCVLFFISNVQPINAQNNSSKATIEQSKVFKAGASTSNITPSLGGGIIGEWGTPEATHIHDELHARCLVLDDGSTKLVFIVADLLGIKENVTNEAKRIIEEETGIPASNVLISAIHTHSATSAMGIGEERRKWESDSFDEYQNYVIRRFADAVRVAVNNLEPARIGWGVGKVPEHVFVRRWLLKEPVINPFGEYDKVMMNPGVNNENKLKPSSEADPDVTFISVQSIDGKPIGLYANYGLHYVGGTPKGHISADYFAIFADRIQELLGADRQYPPFVGAMSNGTSGNVNNVNYGRTGPAKPMKPYEKMKIVAEDVAREVFRVHNQIEFHDWVPLAAMSEELTLNTRKPDKKMIERAKKIMNQPDSYKPLHVREKTYAERILNNFDDLPDQINVILQAFRIGDLGVVSSPFETFTDTGFEIKEKSPFKTNFVVELANGYLGYLPTPEEHELGGYETWLGTNKVEKDAADKLVQVWLKQFESMK